MFRFIMITIVFLICTYMGFYYGEKYRRRSLNLKEVQKALILLNNEIVYSNTPLPQALLEISQRISPPFSKILTETSLNLQSGEVQSVFEGFTNAYEFYKEEVSLTKDDYKVISDFFKTIGESGVVGQDKIFKITLENININYTDAINEAKVNIKMYRSLGMSIGAMIAIFFI